MTFIDCISHQKQYWSWPKQSVRGHVMLWTYLFELMWLGEPFPCNWLYSALCGKPDWVQLVAYMQHCRTAFKIQRKNLFTSDFYIISSFFLHHSLYLLNCPYSPFQPMRWQSAHIMPSHYHPTFIWVIQAQQ